MQAFSLNPASGVPIKLQVKAHVRYQIVTGLLRPGDQLPPLRDLAAGLSINLNTVVRAVAELEAEGFIYSHQGKGIFVSEEFPGQGNGAALRSLLAGMMQSAMEWGLSTEEMALAIFAHGQLARPPQAAAHRLLLVGGSRLQLRRLQGELEAALPIVVVPVLAEEVQEKARASDYKVVAATLFHAAEARRYLPKAHTVVLAPTHVQETFSGLKALPAGARLVVAARDWLQGARIRGSLELLGLGHLRLEIAVGQTPAALAPALEQADHLLTTPDCREIAREVLAHRSAPSMITEPVEVPPEAVSTIRRLLGTYGGDPHIHVRSAWI